MNRIKLFAITLILCVTGVVYAANDHAKHKAQSCPKDGSACCAAHKSGAPKADKKESCCRPGASCCAAHKAGDKKAAGQQAKQEGGESCCVAGAECCNGGSCCAKHKQ